MRAIQAKVDYWGSVYTLKHGAELTNVHITLGYGKNYEKLGIKLDAWYKVSARPLKGAIVLKRRRPVTGNGYPRYGGTVHNIALCSGALHMYFGKVPDQLYIRQIKTK